MTNSSSGEHWQVVNWLGKCKLRERNGLDIFGMRALAKEKTCPHLVHRWVLEKMMQIVWVKQVQPHSHTFPLVTLQMEATRKS